MRVVDAGASAGGAAAHHDRAVDGVAFCAHATRAVGSTAWSGADRARFAEETGHAPAAPGMTAALGERRETEVDALKRIHRTEERGEMVVPLVLRAP